MLLFWCFHKLLLPPAHWFSSVCMAVLPRRVCTKIFFFHLFPETVNLFPVGGILPCWVMSVLSSSPLWKCTYLKLCLCKWCWKDKTKRGRHGLSTWGTGTNLLTAILKRLPRAVLVFVVLYIHMGLEKWKRVKQPRQPTLSAGFLFLYFLDHYIALPGSLCCSSDQLFPEYSSYLVPSSSSSLTWTFLEKSPTLWALSMHLQINQSAEIAFCLFLNGLAP